MFDPAALTVVISLCCLCLCYSVLQEFDRINEGELSAVTRLASEREDNMMWKEFRDKLLKNLGLVS